MTALNNFDRLLRQELVHRVVDPLLRRCRTLLEFNRVIRNGRFSGQHERGMQMIAVDQIIGTVGRGADFDRQFRPRRRNMEHRWMKIQEMFEHDQPLPAVEVYKVDDAYFVSDGHHRVSVARANGAAYIDAHVIEIDVDEPLPACDTP